MAKNNSGRSIWDNPFGGFFDFNGDGKEDLGEQWIAYQIFNECSKDSSSSSSAFSWDDDDEDSSWNELCEDAIDLGLDPDDFDDEDDLREALETADMGISSSPRDCPVPDKPKEIAEADYPNKRRYNAARVLANEFYYFNNDYYLIEKERSQFILDNADTIIAANYLSRSAGFLYSQAVKENFDLSFTLPDEDETREFEFYQILVKIAKRDIPLSFKVWDWCFEQFMPYVQYDSYAPHAMTTSVINQIREFPDGYTLLLVKHIDNDPDFAKALLEAKCETSIRMPELIVAAIKDGMYDTAMTIFKSTLKKAGENWREINNLAENMIFFSRDYSEVETIEYFRDNMLPIIKDIQIGMVQDEIAEWDASIAKHVADVVASSSKYAYSRENAWRASVPSGRKYGLNPRNYDTEQEYLKALDKVRYSWREQYKGRDTLGLNVKNFETHEEYRLAYKERLQEKQIQDRLRREEKQKRREEERRQEQQRAMRDALEDKTVYTICGVSFYHGTHPYHYLTDDTSLEIGSTVIVPVEDKEAEGIVISVGQYLRAAAPFPIDKMKKIKGIKA